MGDVDTLVGERRPVVEARWQTFDPVSSTATWWAQFRQPDGSVTVRNKPGQKPVPALRYGTEPLAERRIVYTDHGERERLADEISTDTVAAVVVHGEVWQRQHRGVIRSRGIDPAGRTVDVVWRLNRRHEIVVITAMVVV